MWVMTTRGFFSAVQDRDEPTRLLIRARCEQDIRNLKDLLPNSEPWRLVRSDYEWRLSCTTAEWMGALANMALEIDYANFKNAVKATQGTKRANVYMRVWSALLALEPKRRWSGGGGVQQLSADHFTCACGRWTLASKCPWCEGGDPALKTLAKPKPKTRAKPKRRRP